MTNIAKTKYTSQYMDNMSFDDVYKQNAVELLVENEDETGLVRQKVINTGLFDGYSLSDFDIASDPIFTGSINADGFWVIKEINTTTGTTRYAVGETDYPANWENRNLLTYNYLNNNYGGIPN